MKDVWNQSSNSLRDVRDIPLRPGNIFTWHSIDACFRINFAVIIAFHAYRVHIPQWSILSGSNFMDSLKKIWWIHVKLSMITTLKNAPASNIRPTELVKQWNIGQGWIGLQLGWRTDKTGGGKVPCFKWENISTTRMKQHSDTGTQHGTLYSFKSAFQIEQKEFYWCWGEFILISAHHPSEASDCHWTWCLSDLYVCMYVVFTCLFIPWWWR